MINGVSTGANLHDYFEKPAIEGILTEHIRGEVDHHRVLWQLIVLQEWLSQNNAN